MRWIAVLIFAGSCESGFAPKPLPELVKPAPPVVATAASARLLLPPGESLIWQVHADGIVIGRAELVVSNDEVHSKFATNALASMFAPVRYELATALDRAGARPRAAEETIAIAGDTSHAAATFDGTHAAIDATNLDAPAPIHTLHTALGWLRAWARDGAPPAVVYVVHDRELYRIEIAAPVRETLRERATLRFDAHAGAVALVVWLSDDAKRTPLRIVAKAGGIDVVAELVT
ncbi:MAG TPA: DUF3108 domain-containing protein [Kofleriaceae bacterium]|nr:DUF3108 domain-containing protein [Kofleriaceae bacterium]